MIKKLIALALIALVIWGVWFFFLSAGDECTVTLKTGEQEQITVRELRSIYTKDAYNWSNYSGCRITGEGKITKIDAGRDDFAFELEGEDRAKMYYTVRIGNGIKIQVTGEQMDGFAVGDKVSYTGILTTGNGKLHIYVKSIGTEPCMVRLA